MTQGWAVVLESPLAHFFNSEQKGKCGQLRSLCFGAEGHEEQMTLVSLEDTTAPLCGHCLQEVEFRKNHPSLFVNPLPPQGSR